MKKLRLTPEEKDRLMRCIKDKFELDCGGNINEFAITKSDVESYLKDIMKEETLKPTILITAEAYVKMLELVNQSSTEISWHGMVKRNNSKNIYLLYDILVFPQINSATSTTTNENDFAAWQTELIMDPKFPIEDLRMHGHSHVMMNVFSSGIDDGYQRDLIRKVEDGDYYIFMVFNKKMEIYPMLYDFNQQILFTDKDINIQIITNDNKNIKEWCKNQINEYCKTAVSKTYPTHKAFQKPITNYYDDDDYIINYGKPKFGGKR